MTEPHAAALPRGVDIGRSEMADVRDVAAEPSADSSFRTFFVGNVAAMTRLAALLGADDPEDVAQEAFARLHVRSSRLRDADAALAYVRSTVCNLSRSRLRHLAVVRRTAPRLLAAAPAMPDEVALHNDEARRIVAAVRDLPRRQREVVVLRYWMRLSEREIAESLQISPGSVKRHASRGLATLQQRLEEPR